MSGEQSQDMTRAAGNEAARQEDPAMTTPVVEERPRPDAVPLVTAGTEETSGTQDASGQEEYAAIRAATLAMSGAPDHTQEHSQAPAPDHEPAAEGEPAGETAPAPSADQETGPIADAAQGQDSPLIIQDGSPDVLAAQAAGTPPEERTDTTDAAEATSDAAGDASAPPSENAAVPATGGDGGDPPPAGPPAAEEETPDPSEKPMSLLDHLNEMRWRLVRCLIAAAVGFCVCWAFVEPIFAVLVKPLLAVLPDGGNAMYSTMPEAFFIRMFVACIAGVFLASPVIFYQIWAFISPGLYEEEKLFIVPVAIISAVFFVGGALFCYYIVFPFAFQFFMSYNTEQIRVMPRISDYVDFVLKLLIAFGLIFEMPLFAFFLSRMGVLTAAMMRQAPRYAILGIFIVAAILTPPDVLSQLLMAVPMLVLYEISVIVAAVFGKKKKTAEPADGEDESEPQDDGHRTGEQA